MKILNFFFFSFLYHFYSLKQINNASIISNINDDNAPPILNAKIPKHLIKSKKLQNSWFISLWLKVSDQDELSDFYIIYQSNYGGIPLNTFSIIVNDAIIPIETNMWFSFFFLLHLINYLLIKISMC